MQFDIATIHFDTHRVFRLLGEKGFTEEQAEGILSVIQEVQLVGVATKQDISDIRKEIADVREEINGVRLEVNNLRAEIYRMMLIQTAATVTLTVTLLKLLG